MSLKKEINFLKNYIKDIFDLVSDSSKDLKNIIKLMEIKKYIHPVNCLKDVAIVKKYKIKSFINWTKSLKVFFPQNNWIKSS
mgnify:CR=1 FL=1|tara:strand:+ start:140 stop:385 length:246 start_codon:yes stop_codon:yes gene_type:complete